MKVAKKIMTVPTANGCFTILHPAAMDDGWPTIYAIFIQIVSHIRTTGGDNKGLVHWNPDYS